MSLEPLASASLVIQLHVACAIAASGLGALILFRKKGGLVHRTLGRVWVTLMLGVALSSFFINENQVIGPFGPIHALSLFTLFGLAQGLYFAIRRNIPAHRAAMRGLYGGSLIIAGAFTFLPGRRMHAALFGPEAGLTPSLVALALAAVALVLIYRPLRLKRSRAHRAA